MTRSVFYEEVRRKIRRYLPVGLQSANVLIKEVELLGDDTALLSIKKSGEKSAPVMNVEPYFQKIQEGAYVDDVLIMMAFAYTQMANPYAQSR